MHVVVSSFENSDEWCVREGVRKCVAASARQRLEIHTHIMCEREGEMERADNTGEDQGCIHTHGERSKKSREEACGEIAAERERDRGREEAVVVERRGE